MMKEELKATEALLDIGVSLPLRPVKAGRLKIVPRVTMKRPPLGGLLRVLRVWHAIDVPVEDIYKMDRDEQLRFMGQHGKAVAKMVALTIRSGWLSGKLVAPLIAKFLLWRCHPDVLLYAAAEFMSLIDTKSFMTIIRLVELIDVTKPRLSQRTRRS